MDPSWGQGWSVGLRVWIERAGLAILGEGRCSLLEGIDQQHSISAAARQLGMSYRRAWELVQSINEAAGQPLVVAATGGAGGGGAQLTSLGRWAVGVFREVQQQVRLTAAAALPHFVDPAETSILHVAAAASLEGVLRELLAGYGLQEPAVRVQTVFGASDELVNHILAGAATDLLLTADPGQLEKLEARGLIATGSGRVLANTTLAAITQRDSSQALTRPAHLKRLAVRHIALARPESPAGRYTQAYLESLQLTETVAAKAVWVENSRAVVAAIRARQAEVGLVYASDAFGADGCRVLFIIRNLPIPVEFAAAVVGRGPGSPAAARLLQFLATPSSAIAFRRFGFFSTLRSS